ncbi:MAG: hypothetical protein JO033_13500 [Acidobacteriaceae bacterium]|nr:hypothetical protein [Acidobacteriaceae bacterium]MBV9502721.1 hypothetical protein [Acidobacteriaceae bacterium]
MAKFTLPIGTSDPVNVCYGLPLFPTGAARAGAYGSFRSFKLLDVSATIFVTRLKVGAYAEYAFGVCGPSVAFLFKNIQAETKNENSKGQLSLTFNGQELEAGGFVGASVGAGINLAFQIYSSSTWYKPWQLSWNDAFTTSLNFSIDFFGLLVELIKYLLGRNSKNTFEKANGDMLDGVLPKIKTYIFLDSTSNSGVRRELSAAPELVLPINLANLIPPLRALNTSFSKIGGEISVGPSFHIGLPVTLGLDSFTVQGGLEGQNSATYSSLVYQDGNKVVATGNVLFEESVTPSKMTTSVHYETGFSLGLSYHFRVTVAKMFNFEVNSPTLDFTKLLYGLSNYEPKITQKGSVSTGIQNRCLLLPDLTLAIKPVNGSASIFAGDQLVGVLELSMPYPGPTAENNVSLKIEPDAPGFPKSLTIAPGAKTSSIFNYTFPNQSLLTGNLYDPLQTTPPGPVYTVQTYIITASIDSLSSEPCAEFEVVLPLNVNNRYIRCQRSFGVAGSKPPWDETENGLASATVNALNSPPPAGLSYVGMSCWFPYPPGQAPAPIPIKFTLLDENRLPHAASNVEVASGGATAKLSPSATLIVTPTGAFSSSTNVSINWLSKGPRNEYSNRFFLVIDAGSAYGQTEFWLDVWNWS